MNKLKVFFAVLLTVVTLTHSKPSQAAVGLFTGGATAIVGLKVIAVGVVGGFIATSAVLSDCNEMGCMAGIVPMIAGAAVAAIGVIILDGEQEIEFQSLKAAEATSLGISQAERLSFNAELDQVNMLLADVASEMSKLEKPTPQDSAAAWNDVKDLVSPLTFAAMKKIASQK